VIREDKKNKNILYAGSERGFYISNDAGASWSTFQLNLPIVPVTDLIIRDNDLVAATAGRAFWILDDLSAVQQNEQFNNFSSVKLITPKPSYKYGAGNGLPEKNEEGQNAPDGVILDYFLPENLSEKDTVTLEIMDKKGAIIRTYSNIKDGSYKKYPGGPAPETLLSSIKGHNRFLWNFRTNSERPDVNGVFVLGNYAGYAVAPGDYKATITLKAFNTTTSQSNSTSFTVLPNPFIKATQEDWELQQNTLASISAYINEIHTSVNKLRKVKKQLEYYNEMLANVPKASLIKEAATSIISTMDAWESTIVESRTKNGQDVINWPSKLNVEFFYLKGLVDISDPVITEGVKNKLKDLKATWTSEKLKFDTILESVNNFNNQFKNADLPALQF
jgi:hypothetical protein